MDFYQSYNGSSTSSNHSNGKSKSNCNSNSNSSHKSNLSNKNSGGDIACNLEYCTSSSSISPFASAKSCPTALAAEVIATTIDEMSLPSNKHFYSSQSLSSSSSSYGQLSLLSRNNSSQLQATRKRKFSNLDEQDRELGFEPSAKRQHKTPSSYQSDCSSVVSSMYPSPIDEIVNDIDTHSSSDSLSTSTDYDESHEDIPDSPRSLQNESVEDDDEIVSGTTSPSIGSNANSKTSRSKVQQHACIESETYEKHLPHHNKKVTRLGNEGNDNNVEILSSAHYHCMTPAAEPESPRQCPLPALSWANALDVWQLMCKKDEQAACLRDAAMLDQHPGLHPRMRAILLDWLIEVCEVYKLHRETYYLAVDYLDRYLSIQKKVQKTHLQLIGITCLFLAAKVEEIYPPKIGEFAYVTDGACQESDILQHEILLLQTLEWNISPVTPMGWLGVYMQLNMNNRTPATFSTARKMAQSYKTGASSGTEETDDAFIYPQFSGLEFVQTAQLLDLCSLDVGMGNFSYSVLAAAAISHTFNKETALHCSGFDWQTIQSCAAWMEPFFMVICEESNHLHLIEQSEQVSTSYGMSYVCPNIVTDDSHTIQTHRTTMGMFARACEVKEELSNITRNINHEASPATGLKMCPDGLLTPPSSSRKGLGDVDDVDEEEDATTVDVVVTSENRENTAITCGEIIKKTS